ncbi:PREDICTED: uncharacterized protein LOC108358294 isoform X1 [Rhagoletis zephyria]|uniref:uncharacterized protein LOC118749571 n=1 Tax=Rhagoletis pomonella TaxID=28610 RepID=UPI0008117DCD|nr:PREDICTED: uncharacterized protein LOC108358294 isoform X1 [Rhagoletis zephyria]XP_017465017.1 PREDICTED: uncharacterized protein LOC108358294 isoform X1 [Rhagoletis zephyria]XP_017465018.1 PREDICTED: uncharacterized protein LOC108358294 isoform X1 [Rhagoletis zephyria]XP_036340265.1 uncharacterized protein LOC118749571 [Rhagoletis pomonella]XP_036340266.1 uncharacterized protein LOC118749571 [Rhagoletis pomonella]
MPKQVNVQKTSAIDDSSVKTQESTLNGSDNIITISTSSIANECHSSSLKEDSLKAVSFNSELAASDTATRQHSCTHQKSASISAANSEEHTQIRSSAHCYDLSRCISFQENIANIHYRRGRRLHGFQLPLHPLQVFGWLVLLLFGISSFLVLIPSFTTEIQGLLYGLISGLYVVHIASHLAALLIDPADLELQRVHRNDRIVPEFDRNKHAHVIENGRCHLCNIRTSSPRTKHCSVCNKCVGKFDHHCKWLNHCIGSRNYVAFLMCVVSAVIATVVIVVAVVAQIVLYNVHPEWVNFWPLTAENRESGGVENPTAVLFIPNDNTIYDPNVEAASVTHNFDFTANVTNNVTEYMLDNDLLSGNATLSILAEDVSLSIAVNETLLLSLNQTFTVTELALNAAGDISFNNVSAATIAGISETIFLVLIGFLGFLAAIAAGLLLHLCFFHIYISFLGLTTYEYIRNHRQAQENKAKQTISNLSKEGRQHFPLTPSKNNSDSGQIFFCSSVRHPNAINTADMHYFEARNPLPKHEESSPPKLHCCVNSEEYHQSAMKTYYICSLLEENATNSPFGISHISDSGSCRDGNLHGGSETSEVIDSDYKTFHCYSSLHALATERRVSAATSKATLVSDLEAGHSRRSNQQYTEQCTLCTFRIRSPIVSKRVGDVSSRSASGIHHSSQSHMELSPMPRTILEGSKGVSSGHQRCCMKSISKNQSWCRRWNCCSNVPDSPDVPNDLIAALAVPHKHTRSRNNMKPTEISVQFKKKANGSGDRDSPSSSRPTSPRSANLNSNSRVPISRTWPMPRLLHMMRMLSRFRRMRCRQPGGNGAVGSINERQVKHNQIRPLHLKTSSNGVYSHHHLIHQQKHFNDSSSPQPPSSTTTTSEWSDQSMYSDSSNLTTPPGQTPNAIKTILPTSVIRDDTSMTYTTSIEITTPPALPPPTRRKIPSPTNLVELADTLSFVSHSPGRSSLTLSPAQRLPTLSNVYRRQRRKHFLRTRSPTLSPIHETGLSNPTSPQPGRHITVTSSSTVAASGSLGDSTELTREDSSYSSKNSVSSNPSST